MSRSLPASQNPFIEADQTPSHQALVETRRLGCTVFSFLGQRDVLEYAHLKVKLPRDLTGSEVFRPTSSTPVPDSYFLMRRSNDGFVSATGMFRAAFPWATKQQEQAELSSLRRSKSVLSEEAAGNHWIDAKTALDLAVDYNISAWIRALLDPQPILSANASHADIAQPPAFTMPASRKHSSPDDARSSSKRTVSRETRSTSPAKTSQPPSERVKASPRKRGRKPKKATIDAEVDDASKSLQDIINGAPTLENGADGNDVDDAIEEEDAAVAAIAEAVVDELGEPLVAAINGESDPIPEDTARVTITSNVIEGENGEEVTQTSVKIDMPLDAEAQALPASPEQMTKDAKEIVKDALQLQKTKDAEDTKKSTSKRSRKRKASELQAEDDSIVAAVAAAAEASPSSKSPEEVVQELVPAATSDEPPTKRSRVMVPAEEYQRERMQRRALMGTAVAAGIGFAWTAMPYAFEFASNLGNLF